MATVGEVVSHDKEDRRHRRRRREPKSHPRKSAMWNKEAPKRDGALDRSCLNVKRHPLTFRQRETEAAREGRGGSEMSERSPVVNENKRKRSAFNIAL